MEQKKGKAALIIAGIAALATGGFAFSFDFSQTTDTRITGDTIIEGDEGDTIIGSLIDEEAIANAILERVCILDVIPEQYQEVCEDYED